MPQIAFQFSLEEKWERKLRQDVRKIRRNCSTIERIVFVSNRSITIKKQDKLRRETQQQENVDVEICDEGWLRVRLEEQHIDLTQKHLGITIEVTHSFFTAQVAIYGMTDQNRVEILRHTTPQALVAMFDAQISADSKNVGAWKGLAHVRYYLREYDRALVAVSTALKLSEDEVERWNLVALKASIIAEQGIRSHSRPLLKKARELILPFIERLGRSIDHYNLANILGALDERGSAEIHYRAGLELDPNFAPAWTNFGLFFSAFKCVDSQRIRRSRTNVAQWLLAHLWSSQVRQRAGRNWAIDTPFRRRWPDFISIDHCSFAAHSTRLSTRWVYRRDLEVALRLTA